MNKIFIFAVVAVASISIYPMEEASELDKIDIVLANVEALSDDEANTGRPNICYKMLDGLQGAPMVNKIDYGETINRNFFSLFYWLLCSFNKYRGQWRSVRCYKG